MFDTMTMVKAVGSFCGALLVLLFANWAAQSLYFGGEGHAEHPQSYEIAVAEAEPSATDETKAEPTYADVSATADIAAGMKSFGACKACHKIDGTNATGPHLNGVVGRGHAEVAGFAYSEAILASKGTPWTPEELFAFLKSPKTYMPGTKMGYAGMPKPQDRANVIAYMASLP